MPRCKPPRRRRRASTVDRGLLDTYDKIIRLFDTVDRDVTRCADAAPAKEVAEARAMLEQGRRDFQALRAMALAPPRWPGLAAAMREGGPGFPGPA